MFILNVFSVDVVEIWWLGGFYTPEPLEYLGISSGFVPLELRNVSYSWFLSLVFSIFSVEILSS